MFVGAVNHWIALIAYKRRWESLSDKKQTKYIRQEKLQTKFFLLDSSNIQHLKET